MVPSVYCVGSEQQSVYGKNLLFCNMKSLKNRNVLNWKYLRVTLLSTLHPMMRKPRSSVRGTLSCESDRDLSL